ncbi:MAG TPA: hypothetical protein VKZ60_20360 [Chloroflexota bacterium]|jgi:predicted metal-dependent enzyme (double-stranded beta helix superfamily)|nr:hypothetical protein [Chloroflexota bacterium]
MAMAREVHGEPADEFWLDTPLLRAFVADVRATLECHADDIARGLEALRPRFAALLADPHWLPDAYAAVNPSSGMGGGIGQWLLYRAADRSLSLFSLVVPPGASTPVHDHLAWGLVGLYRGVQEEVVYRRLDSGGEDTDRADLQRVAVRRLEPGDFYTLLPPEGDIHAVTTQSDIPSVSIHLLGNDVGCIWRHAYDPAAGRVRRFRSGYSNAPCPETG